MQQEEDSFVRSAFSAASALLWFSARLSLLAYASLLLAVFLHFAFFSAYIPESEHTFQANAGPAIFRLVWFGFNTGSCEKEHLKGQLTVSP